MKIINIELRDGKILFQTENGEWYDINGQWVNINRR